MMVRYTKERQKQRRKQKFDLEDSDKEDVGLTHGGRPIEELDDFNERIGSESEEDPDNPEAGLMDDDIVNKLHFGGKGLRDSDEEQGDLFTVKKTRE